MILFIAVISRSRRPNGTAARRLPARATYSTAAGRSSHPAILIWMDSYIPVNNTGGLPCVGRTRRHIVLKEQCAECPSGVYSYQCAAESNGTLPVLRLRTFPHVYQARCVCVCVPSAGQHTCRWDKTLGTLCCVRGVSGKDGESLDCGIIGGYQNLRNFLIG